MTADEQTTYLQELKNFVLLHCKAQQLKTEHVIQALDKITHVGDNEEGSWCSQWFQLAKQQEKDRHWSEATKLFNMARFPFIQNETQKMAHTACVTNFKKSMESAGVKIETLSLCSGAFKTYATGLDQNWPVLVVCGGIVSIKEQWQRFLLLSKRLKLCIVITEMPGVGENALRYTSDSWTMFPQIIDSLEGRADTQKCHLMAMSFSGHLALLAAATDSRICGITTVGAPIVDFFRQYSEDTIPMVTRYTLSHLTGLTQGALYLQIPSWQIDIEKTPKLTIPVYYLQSEYDEIIPLSEIASLNKIALNTQVYRLPDVHGSPNNMHLVAPWALTSILSSFPSRRNQAFIFKLLWKTKVFISRYLTKH